MENILFTILFFVLAVVVFWLVSQKFMYNITQFVTNLAGLETSSADGVPNLGGTIMHGVVLALILTILGHFLLMK
jgi:hypothetical protein